MSGREDTGGGAVGNTGGEANNSGGEYLAPDPVLSAAEDTLLAQNNLGGKGRGIPDMGAVVITDSSGVQVDTPPYLLLLFRLITS